MQRIAASERWVRKLLAQMRREGDGVVVHGLRGQPSNRGIAEALRKRAVEALLDPDWHDFRAYVRRRATGQAAWDRGEQGDGAEMDGRSRALAEPAAEAEGGAQLAAAAELLWGKPT